MRKLLLATVLSLAIAVPALAAEPSEASLERLFVVTQVEKLSQSMIQQVNTMLKPAFEQALNANKDLTPEERARAQEFSEEYGRKMAPILAEELSWSRMKELHLQIYRSSFTQEEIDGLISFYESPAGKAMIEKMPIVMQKSMTAMQQRMGPMMQKIARAAAETVEAMKAKQAPAKQAPGKTLS